MKSLKFFRNTYFWLVLIIILGAFLRLWQLGHVPISPDWDEAALGYNAYSILHTGHDEYGKLLPVVFRSFDDYKPGLYVYLVIPFIQFFGLSVWATRLPSVIAGIITIIATYFVVRDLLKNEKIALLSSFFLSISPWHIQFSRVAFESNVGVMCNLLSVLFFIKSFKKPWLLFVSIATTVASMYVYQSDKVFAPLLFILLIIIYRKSVLALKKQFLVFAVIFGIVLCLPLGIYTLTNKSAFARAQGVSIFADTTQTLQRNAGQLLADKQRHDIIGEIMDNRRLFFTKEVAANYLSHFDFNWLFVTGDIDRHHAPGMGLMYLWELPFLLIGIGFLLFGPFTKKSKILFFLWYLLVPIPASITTGVPHAVRTLNFLPLLQIATALGVYTAYRGISKISQSYIRNGIFAIIFLLGVFNFSYYLNQYFVQQNYYESEFWQYGYGEAVPFVQQQQSKYKKIVISNQPYMDQSYIFFLFYLQYSPQKYQLESAKVSGGFRENHSFGKYEFRPIDWNTEQKSEDILYVGRAQDFPTGVNTLKKINFLNGKAAMTIVKG